jgi:enoyl-CoA hydratase/carnithine racemase
MAEPVRIQPRSFRYEPRDTGVATITLDRPERLNALTFEVYAELRDTFAQLDRADEVRAVVVTGAGRGFCSGGDVEDIIGALFGRESAGLHEFTTMTCDVILNLRRCGKPVIAAINGVAAGAGAVIAAACDFRIAAESARIAFLFPRVGLSGADMGASWLLPRLVGLGRATELLMTGEFVDAARALEMGLYHRVVAQDMVLPEAIALAEKLARGPAAALAATKRAIDDEFELDLESALEYEARVQAELMEHPDYREAYEAFREKREPRFR